MDLATELEAQNERDERNAISRLQSYGIAFAVAESLANAHRLSDIIRLCDQVDQKDDIEKVPAYIVGALNRILPPARRREPVPGYKAPQLPDPRAKRRVPMDYMPRSEAAKTCERCSIVADQKNAERARAAYAAEHDIEIDEQVKDSTP